MQITITEVTSASRTIEPHPGAAALCVGDTIDVGQELGGGGFGTVYRCDAVAGAPGSGLVIKRHIPNTTIMPEDNAAVLAALHDAIDGAWGTTPADARRHLPAVPYWVGRARWGTDDAVISLSRDLGVEGYCGLDEVLQDLHRFRAWLGLDMSERMAAAHDFASSHAMAEEIGFVHADINVENVFIDPAGGRAAIIDWDSGVLPGSPNAGPLAWGKADDFIAPEAKAGGVLDASVIGELTERWSVGYLVHYLLFGVGPLFFLATLSDAHINQYLATHTWPDIDQNSPLFNAPNRAFYSRYLQDLADLPPSVIDLFQRFVTYGCADPTLRPTSAEWRDALLGASVPATFDWVALSSPAMVRGGEVRVSWDAPSAQAVFVDGHGPFPPAGWAAVSYSATQAIHLTARNTWGSTDHVTAAVVVVDLAPPPTFRVATTWVQLPPPVELDIAGPAGTPRLGPAPTTSVPSVALPRRLRSQPGMRLLAGRGRPSIGRPWFRRSTP